MPIFTAPFPCFTPANVAAGGTILTDPIPCFGAKQVTVCVTAQNAPSLLGTITSGSALVPLADSSLVGTGSVVVHATGITAGTTVTNITPDTHAGCGTTVGSTAATVGSTALLVVGQGLACLTAGVLAEGTRIAALPGGVAVTLDRPALATSTGRLFNAARMQMSANAIGGATLPMATIGVTGVNLSAAAACTFSNDGVTFTTPAALIGTTAVTEYKAAITQELNTGGQYFTVCLGSAAPPALPVVGFPVNFVRFSFTTSATVQLINATAAAFVFGENFTGCY